MSTSQIIEWNRHTETPAHHPVTAIIACYSDCGDGALFLHSDIHEWLGDHWRNERTQGVIDEAFGDFWWMLEMPLLEAIIADQAFSIPSPPHVRRGR